MVTEGIVLGHVVSERGIQVDKAKVEVISKLPFPTNQKEIRGFLESTEKSETPLDVSPVSVYKPSVVKALREEKERKEGAEKEIERKTVENVEGSGDVEKAGVVEGGEGEKNEEEKKDGQTDPEECTGEDVVNKGPDEMGEKESLMTEEEFEELLDGVETQEKVVEAEENPEKEDAGMAEARDPEFVEKEVTADDNVGVSNKPEAEVEAETEEQEEAPKGHKRVKKEACVEG